MAGKKDKISLITEELDWYETEVEQARAYLTGIILTEVKDREGFVKTAKGGIIPVVIIKKEDIAEHKIKMLEKIPKLLADLDNLRKREETIKNAKGGGNTPAWAESKKE